ncbi:hypothetical protein GCM10009760_30140 [Kitasatospora kazusensis]|uniref:Uncharacterized protein n=1 Tax=Kitasatospora kazusensis TaxID=407974 RepID=A0ABN2ZKP0_9ACTN
MTDDAQAEYRATEMFTTPEYRQGTPVEYEPVERLREGTPVEYSPVERMPVEVPEHQMARLLPDGVMPAQTARVGEMLPDGVMPAQTARVGEMLPDGVMPAQTARVGEMLPDGVTPAQTARVEQMPVEMPAHQMMAQKSSGEPAPEGVPATPGMPLSGAGVESAQKSSGEPAPEGVPATPGMPLSGAGVESAQKSSGEPAPEGEPATPGTPLSGSGLSPRIGTQMQPTTPAQSAAAPGSSSASGSGGGAGQGFQVRPEQYGAAVSPMLAASEAIAALYTSLNSYLPSMESQAPWGKDESGKQFAEGDKGYLKYSADTLKALKGMPDGLKYIADGLKSMAQGYEGADGSTASDLAGQEGQLQSSPPPAYTPPMHIPISPSITLEHMNTGKH